MTEQMTGAQALVRALEQVGVDTVFGIPGGAILPAYDPLYDSAKVRHVLVRHEQGAGHAAQGYAQATGKVGVCMATSGPGATNLVTPIADAYMDSVPIVAITGQVVSSCHRHGRLPGSRHLRHHDADHQAQLPGHQTPRTSPGPSPRRSTSPRPGVRGRCWSTSPRTRCTSTMTFPWPPVMQLPGYRPVTRPHSKQIREAARLIIEAKRPVLYVGGGVHRARRLGGAAGARRADRHPRRHHADGARHLPRQPPAAHGHARHARHRCPRSARCRSRDLLIALGARFDDRVTGQLSTFAPHAKVIHADIDPAEISKNRHADVPIVGDCREVITDLIAGGAQATAARATTPSGGRRSTATRRPTRWATTSSRTARSPRSTSWSG